MDTMNKIIWHWTAGLYGVNHVEEDAYHAIIQPAGSVSWGIDAIEDNFPPLRPGAYAAHTLNANSRSIGLAVDAMYGAVERPFYAGPAPITRRQVTSLVTLTARLNFKYNIPVTRETNLSHAEVERTLGIKQNNKWDIMWLPGMDKPGDPIKVGDMLREMVREAMGGRLARETEAISPAPVRPKASPHRSGNNR